MTTGIYLSGTASIGIDADIASLSNERTQTPENLENLYTNACLVSSSISGTWRSKFFKADISSNLTLTARSPSTLQVSRPFLLVRRATRIPPTNPAMLLLLLQDPSPLMMR